MRKNPCEAKKKLEVNVQEPHLGNYSKAGLFLLKSKTSGSLPVRDNFTNSNHSNTKLSDQHAN